MSEPKEEEAVGEAEEAEEAEEVAEEEGEEEAAEVATLGAPPQLSGLSCKGGQLVLDGLAHHAAPSAPTSTSDSGPYSGPPGGDNQLASAPSPRFACQGDRLMITDGAPPPPPRLAELASHLSQVPTLALAVALALALALALSPSPSPNPKPNPDHLSQVGARFAERWVLTPEP